MFLQTVPGYAADYPVENVFGSVFNIKSFGAVGDGVADDTVPIKKAISEWINSASGGVLDIPPGVYRVSSPLEISFKSDNEKNKAIFGIGATLVFDLKETGVGLSIVSNNNYVRNLFVVGLRIKIVNEKCSVALLLDGGDLNTSWLYAVTILFLTIDLYDSGGGLHIANNVFESMFSGISVRNFKNLTGYPILVHMTNTGVPSSLRFENCNTDGGIVGMYVKGPVSDVSCTGNTHIRANTFGLKFDNFVGGVLTNIHLENNWAGADDRGSGGAGLYVAGFGMLNGIYGTGNYLNKQKYVIELYITKTITVFAGAMHGTVEMYGKIRGKTGSATLISDDDKGYNLIGGVNLRLLSDIK